MNERDFVPGGDRAEVDRIRDVYRRRDRPDRASRRGGAMVEAYQPRLGWPTDRLAGTDLVAERLEVAALNARASSSA